MTNKSQTADVAQILEPTKSVATDTAVASSQPEAPVQTSSAFTGDVSADDLGTNELSIVQASSATSKDHPEGSVLLNKSFVLSEPEESFTMSVLGYEFYVKETYESGKANTPPTEKRIIRREAKSRIEAKEKYGLNCDEGPNQTAAPALKMKIAVIANNNQQDSLHFTHTFNGKKVGYIEWDADSKTAYRGSKCGTYPGVAQQVMLYQKATSNLPYQQWNIATELVRTGSVKTWIPTIASGDKNSEEFVLWAQANLL